MPSPRAKLAVRAVVYGVLGLLVLVSLAVRGLRTAYPPEKIRAMLADGCTAAFGVPVEIGSAEWDLFPVPSLLVEDLRVPAPSGRVLLSAPETRLLIIPWSFGERKVLVTETTLTRPMADLGVFPADLAALRAMAEDVKKRREEAGKKSSGTVIFRKFNVREGDFLFSWVAPSGGTVPVRLTADVQGLYRHDEMIFDFVADARGADEPFGVLRLKGSIGGRSELEGRLTGFPAASLRELLPEAAAVRGNLEARGTYVQSPGSSASWSWIGEARDLSILGGPEDASARLTWNQASGGILEAGLAAASPRCDLEVRLAVPDFSKRLARVEAGSDRFDLKEVLAWAAPFKPLAPEKRGPGWKAEGRARVARGRTGPFVFEKAGSGLSVEGGSWRFKGLSAKALGGDVAGGLDVSRGRVTFTGNARDISAEKFLGLWQSSPAVYGKTAMQGSLTGPAGKDFLKGASGKGYFIVRGGSLSQFSTALKVISSLNLRSAFSPGPDPSLAGRTPFQSLESRLRFDLGTIHFSEARLESENLSVKAGGRIDLEGETLDAQVSARAVTVVDEILQHVPVVGKIYGKTKSVVPIWARVRGRLREPDVTVTKPGGVE